MKKFIEYNSDFAEFEPLDAMTPEGEKRARELVEYILNARTRVPKRPPRVIIPYDQYGMFGKPIVNTYILTALVPSEEEREKKSYLWFIKEFAQKYLKGDREGVISYASAESFNPEKVCDSIVWIKKINSIKPKGFEFKNSSFAIDRNNKPVFIFEGDNLRRAERDPEDEKIKWMRGRMESVWKQYQNYLESSANAPKK